MVAIIPTASSIPEKMGKKCVKVSKELGLKNIELVSINSGEDIENKNYSELL